MPNVYLTETVRVGIFWAFSTIVNIVWIVSMCLAAVMFCYLPNRTTIVILN